MDNPQSQKRNLPQSILTSLQYLFVPGRDLSYTYWFLGVITLIGTVMRIWKISQPIAYDEAYTFLQYATQGFKHILADYSAPNNHILHTILVRVFFDIFGRQVWVVRGPALLAGILCIPASYFAARRIFNLQQSLAAAALIAVTPWFISYSVNGRGYSMSRASCPTATIFWSYTSMATIVGSSNSTCEPSARRVNIVPRSMPRSFENIATVFIILIE